MIEPVVMCELQCWNSMCEKCVSNWKMKEQLLIILMYYITETWRTLHLHRQGKKHGVRPNRIRCHGNQKMTMMPLRQHWGFFLQGSPVYSWVQQTTTLLWTSSRKKRQCWWSGIVIIFCLPWPRILFGLTSCSFPWRCGCNVLQVSVSYSKLKKVSLSFYVHAFLKHRISALQFTH